MPTKLTRNSSLKLLDRPYLFQEIASRVERFRHAHSDCELIDLGIGDTVLPLNSRIVEAICHQTQALGTLEGYSGYGPSTGLRALREQIAEKLYHGKLAADEIFISDGAKCDLARLQPLLQPGQTVGIQDPTYPVYHDLSLLGGLQIELLSCTPSNHFFPTLDTLPHLDLLYLCHPNNPTGVAYTHHQLKQLVELALQRGFVIVVDTAYSSYIQDPDVPRSIFEIPGAKQVALEIGSFSKMAGFSGMRLGWSALSRELRFSDGQPIGNDWQRLQATLFNGASLLSQVGGIALLDRLSLHTPDPNICSYMESAAALRIAFQKADYQLVGGENAPYLWIATPEGIGSWDFFDTLLNHHHMVVTPGVGYGPSGEGFFRVSSFLRPEQLERTLQAISQIGSLVASP